MNVLLCKLLSALFISITVSGNNTADFIPIEEPLEKVEHEIPYSSGDNSGFSMDDYLDTVSSNNTESMGLSSDQYYELTSDFLDGLSSTTSSNNVVLGEMNDKLSLLASAQAIQSTFTSYQLSDYFINYFRGYLQNMPSCNYVAWADRVYSGNTYIVHYYLVYNVKKDLDGNAVVGTYPCLDCYTNNGYYYTSNTTRNLSSMPSMGYGSFKGTSALIDNSFNYSRFFMILSAVLIAVIFIRRR